jgi:hypothetical protein
MPSVQNLQITITNSVPNPNGATALVKPGGTVKWFGANAAYSLTLPTSVFPNVTNPVSVPKNGWSAQIDVSASANGTADYSIGAGSTSGELPGNGQPSIMVTP